MGPECYNNYATMLFIKNHRYILYHRTNTATVKVVYYVKRNSAGKAVFLPQSSANNHAKPAQPIFMGFIFQRK